ncbi:MAG: heparan-alpha-glucosaminide N-acetyltransferase domain-containing protein [Gemmatimonadota bacterium]|nr:heparan-alpha-glucosaminide N-acetyltransferase domain-containing protein [Gemmatimonadota bacterium]
MPRQRFDSIDILRGLVMVLMVLDHTRDFVHADALRFDPTDLTRTTPLLFFTRWITHFCAPVFVFLAGVGPALQLDRGRSVPDVGRYLWTRGLWLVLLEFTVVRFGVFFNFSLAFFGFLQVIWVLGISMIVLAALIRLPTTAILAVGAVMVAGHNLLDPIQVLPTAPNQTVVGLGGSLWSILHQSNPIQPFGASMPFGFVAYPLVPWIGVMALGFVFGGAYVRCGDRPRWLAKWGAGLTLAFIAIRAANFYGDPSTWAVQGSGTFTLLSFLNTTKYPPSLLYLLMTLGPGLLFLALLERGSAWPGRRMLLLFGQVPLFFYLLQWYVAHGLGIALSAAAGKPISGYFLDPPEVFNPPPGSGFDLAMVYPVWVIAVAVLYFPCRWWAEQKKVRTEWWVRYL